MGEEGGIIMGVEGGIIMVIIENYEERKTQQLCSVNNPIFQVK